jgi:RNA polymerase sigma-70 factor (ECF subfamily)
LQTVEALARPRPTKSADNANFSPGRTVILDSEDIERCLRGDPEAFAPLVQRYQRVLYNVAYRMVGNPEDARDLTQTALVKAYEKLASYDPRFRFFSWVYRILVNETLNFLERRRTHEPVEACFSLAAPGGPHHELEAAELEGRVQAALLQLHPDHRAVVVLRHFVDQSYQEMSATLGIPEKTVKSRLYSARQRLADLLGGGRERALSGSGA